MQRACHATCPHHSNQPFRHQRKSIDASEVLIQSQGTNEGSGVNAAEKRCNPLAAQPHFEHACERAPAQPLGCLHTGIRLTRLHRYGQALAQLQKARTIDGGNPRVFSSLGDVFRLTGQQAGASEAYRQAISLGDPSALTLAKLGSVTVQLGHHDLGLARIHKAISLDGNAGELQEILATSAFLAGKNAVSREAAERRLTMRDAKAFHYVLAATLYLHTGQLHQAREVLTTGEMVLGRHPEFSVMKTRLSTMTNPYGLEHTC